MLRALIALALILPAPAGVRRRACTNPTTVGRYASGYRRAEKTPRQAAGRKIRRCKKTCAALKPKWASWRSRSTPCKRELKKSEGELQRLDAARKKLQSARTEQQRLIAIQARAAYQSGRQEYLKLLLNQQNPEKFAAP